MDEVDGTTSAGPLLREEHYVRRRAAFGAQMATILASIHRSAIPPEVFGSAPVRPDVVARAEIQRWRTGFDADPAAETEAVTAAFIWLHHNQPPPPSRVVLVHGELPDRQSHVRP